MKSLYSFIIFIIMIKNCYSQSSLLASAELNNKSGCIDRMGNEVIPFIYDDMGFWGNHLIPVNIGATMHDYSKKGGKWGYCNEKGKLVIPIQYEDARQFSEGRAGVKLNGKWGLIDSTGKLIIAPQFDDISLFKEGFCAVSKNKKYGFIDGTGKLVIPLLFDDAYDFNEGVARAFVGKKAYEEDEETEGFYCLIDKTGKRITEPIYKMIQSFHEGLARVEITSEGHESYDRKFGFINKEGKLVIPAEYDNAEDFSDGMAVVGKKTESNALIRHYSFGYIDKKGKLIIPFQYDNARQFQEGKAVVSRGKSQPTGITSISVGSNREIVNHERYPKYALIDKTGKEILGFDWGWLELIDNDLLIASRAKFIGKGVIDLQGNPKVPFEHNNLHYAGNGILIGNNGAGKESISTILDTNNKKFNSGHFHIPNELSIEGMLRARSGDTRKTGYINLKGEFVIKAIYDMLLPFGTTE